MVEPKQDTFSKEPAHSKAPQKELHYLRSKVQDLSSLIEISIIINSTLDQDKLIRLVMEKAQSVMKAEASSVMLISKDGTYLECEVALGEVGDKVKKLQLKMGEGIAGWVAKHGKPQIIPDVLNDERFSSRVDNSTGFQTRSILAAPLIVKDKTIGVAEVINPIDGHAFGGEDLELFSTFCRQVAIAIENTRMHHLELERQRLQQELESAKFIQQSFMPQTFPSSPDQGFSISAKSLAAASIGGDFFDYIEFDKNTIGIAVGDVTGKGVPAALYMARLVSDFRFFTQRNQEPTQVLGELNKVLVERSRRGMFVTFQYGILDASIGKFTYTNAGHIPFIRVRKNGNTALLQGAKSIPLGILSDFQIQASTIQLSHGDYIVLITDGIIEAKKKTGKAYSLNRTMKVLSQRKDTCEAVVESLIQDVQSFSRGMEQHDDLTILALKWE